MSSRRFLADQEILPGATWTHDPGVQLRFAIHVRCEAVHPDRWTGLIVLDGRAIYETKPTDSFEKAAAVARAHLFERMADVIRSEA
jgi:hypothetical protein